jgi:hypothetical protein
MYYNVQPVSGSLVASQVLKVISGLGKGHLHWLFLYNNNAAVRYAMIFDAASLPANGTAPMFMQSMTAATSVPKELAFPPDGLLFTTGCVIAISSTPATLTLAAADLIFTAGIT